MQIAICDDDPMIIKELQKDLEQYFRKHHLSCPPISQFTSGESLLNNKEDKDIVFLDVEMPGLNGIYVGNTLRERYPNILIFIVTSFMEYLDDALAQYHASSKKIAFETKDGFHTLMPSSIVMIEAISKKSVLYTTAKTYHTVHPMQYWLETLPQAQFFRTHRSFIVNMEHVSDFDHSLVYMDVPETNAYLTQRKYHDFKEAYLLFLESMR